MKKIIAGLVLSLIVLNVHSQDIPKWKITDVQKLMDSNEDGILVINFWATFCKPCVAEIPSFISTVDKHKKDKVKLVLISLDLPSYYPEKIAAFAKKSNFNTNISWLEETNADYFCPRIDSSWSGSIPATLIINKKTGFRKFFEGQITEKEFEDALTAAIKSTTTAKIIRADNLLDGPNPYMVPPIPPLTPN
ncbi:MAG: redoxin domain-containing protein [Ferruginibacter sp.]